MQRRRKYTNMYLKNVTTYYSTAYTDIYQCIIYSDTIYISS